MPGTDDILTILFTDISGSTNLYEFLGDEKAHAIIEECLFILATEARLNDGEVIKTMGDGIMCSFRDAAGATDAAIAMNLVIDQISGRFVDRRISLNIRTGFNTGAVIRDNNDIFGDTVNVASRMSSIARPRQIITTISGVNALPDFLREKAQYMDRMNIKGKEGEFDIYEIVWEEGDKTAVIRPDHHKQEHKTTMNIVACERTFRIDGINPAITIGRQEHNTVVMDDIRVSRSHCRIEFRKGKFLFIDHSSNGSYVHDRQGNTSYVHNDEMTLGEGGFICLGHDGREDSGFAVSFRARLR